MMTQFQKGCFLPKCYGNISMKVDFGPNSVISETPGVFSTLENWFSL